MYIDLKNNVIYYQITSNLVEHCIIGKIPIIYTSGNRQINYEEQKEPEINESMFSMNTYKPQVIKNDFTDAERQAGTDKVAEFCVNTPEVFRQYVEAALSEDLYANKLKAKLLINTNRDTTQNAGVTFKEHKFQSAEKDRALLTSTVTLYSAAGKLPEGFTWISQDNKQVPMTLEELVQLGALMGNVVNETAHKARATKDSIEAAKTVKEVDEILNKWQNPEKAETDKNPEKAETDKKAEGK